MTLADITRAADEGSRFTVAHYPGIAFYFDRAETQIDADTEWTGYEVPTGNAVLVMVGDDREHSIDPDDVQTLSDNGYCHECGQIGCTADGRS